LTVKHQDQIGQGTQSATQQDGPKIVEEASRKAQVLLAFSEEDLDFPPEARKSPVSHPV